MAKKKSKRIQAGSVLLGILLIVLFSTGFQKFKKEKDSAFPSSGLQIELKLVNGGLPFRPERAGYVPDRILVKFKPTLSDQAIETTLAAYASKQKKRIPRIDVYEIQIPEGTSVEEMVYVLLQNPDVEFAEPNYKTFITITPNDTLFKYQYALFNSGQEIGVPGSPKGKFRADIKATAAWEETKGDEETIIAVLDTGVDLLHPDIKGKLKGSGRDFVNNDFDATDDHSHGTFVAGIAAAETNNNEGVAGVAWDCKILPVKIMDKEGSGEYSWLIQGIIWAVDNGADVINLSLGGDEPSSSLQSALEYAIEKDVVIVAASGNDGASVLYPAAYDEYCLAVAATDYNDERLGWSNFGPEVDVAAPGERVVGTVPTWYFGPGSFPYGYGFGTSMATPHAAGLAALLRSLKPFLKASDIMDIIRYSADDVNSAKNPGRDEFIGYGRINMEKALAPIKIGK